jgi:hypothetical protein
MDGVLVDFDKRCRQLEIPMVNGWAKDEVLWPTVEKIDHFFLHLEPREDYLELWDRIERLNPTILTAVPKWAQKLHAAKDKREWIASYLGPDVPVITCLGVEKQNYCKSKMDILIDDFGRNIGQWINKGGIGILHHNAHQTNLVLNEIGWV